MNLILLKDSILKENMLTLVTDLHKLFVNDKILELSETDEELGKQSQSVFALFLLLTLRPSDPRV